MQSRFLRFETLLKHYYVTGADFKRFVTFWKRYLATVCLMSKIESFQFYPVFLLTHAWA